MLVDRPLLAFTGLDSPMGLPMFGSEPEQFLPHTPKPTVSDVPDLTSAFTNNPRPPGHETCLRMGVVRIHKSRGSATTSLHPQRATAQDDLVMNVSSSSGLLPVFPP